MGFLLVPKYDCHLLKSILNQNFEINIVLKYGIFFYWTNIMVSVQHTVSWLENHQNLCVTYDITGNDVHFVLDIKTVHLHWPFPCVSPQNFIAFCIEIKIIEYQWFSESSGLSYMCSSPSLSSLSAWNNAPGLTNSLFHSIVWLEFYIKRV